ncbi:MAG: hypothetical protein DELT_02517 [Desulfovibrio sp.]
MKQITFEDGLIQLGGEELPGILTSLRVDGKVKYDEQKVDGTSGKSKTPQGWEDHTLVISLVLTTEAEDDCYDKLERLTPFFKTPDSKANPQIYTIINRHIQTRGIRQVVFDRLESNENSTTDEIRVTLGFTEHNPPIIRTENAVAKTPTPAELAEQAAEAAKKATESPEDEEVISGDLS